MAKDQSTTVDITFRSADVLPPLFVAGSFSQPPWTPHAMACVETAGERVFTKKIFAQPGATIQYKFRVGTGDWWILDESRPTVTDAMGNRNNVLQVENSSARAKSPLTPPRSPPTPTLSVPAPVTSAEGAVPVLQQDRASTPNFVRTTVEVADTAAQIDPQTPEPQISDKEAGRRGVRRLSATPMAEVAATAAEVADTAQELDLPSIEVEIGPDFSHELPGRSNANHDEPPLFAYEVVGEHDKTPSELEFLPEPFSAETPEQPFDVNDPTLERFPSSSRGEILQRVRSIETGLNEDKTLFEGAPPSPVVSSGRKASGSWSESDVGDDGFLGISPGGTPKSPPKPSPRRRSEGSVSRDSNTMLDNSSFLQCIVEESAADGPHQEETDKSAAGQSPKAAAGKFDEASEASSATAASEPDGDSSALAVPAEGSSDQNRNGTPVPLRTPRAGIDNSNGNWFTAFLRLVFVEWLGGFFGKLMGRQQA